MSYRQSSYEPLHVERPGRPVRPYNAWQWLGIASIVAGNLLLFVYLGGELGLWPQRIENFGAPMLAFILGGSSLQTYRHSRDGTATDVSLVPGWQFAGGLVGVGLGAALLGWELLA